jgi:hypothetical protein
VGQGICLRRCGEGEQDDSDQHDPAHEGNTLPAGQEIVLAG